MPSRQRKTYGSFLRAAARWPFRIQDMAADYMHDFLMIVVGHLDGWEENIIQVIILFINMLQVVAWIL